MQIDMQFLSTINAATSVVIGVILGIVSLIYSTRSSTKSRQAQLFMEFYAQATEKRLPEVISEINMRWTWVDVHDFVSKYGPETNPDAFFKFIGVAEYFDSMGTLLKNDLINTKFMPRTIAVTVCMFWEKIEPITKELGLKMGSPGLFDLVEYLYYEVKNLGYTAMAPPSDWAGTQDAENA